MKKTTTSILMLIVSLMLGLSSSAQLDSRNRMNTPGTVGTNWAWRLKADYLSEAAAPQLKALCEKYLR